MKTFVFFQIDYMSIQIGKLCVINILQIKPSSHSPSEREVGKSLINCLYNSTGNGMGRTFSDALTVSLSHFLYHCVMFSPNTVLSFLINFKPLQTEPSPFLSTTWDGILPPYRLNLRLSTIHLSLTYPFILLAHSSLHSLHSNNHSAFHSPMVYSAISQPINTHTHLKLLNRFLFTLMAGFPWTLGWGRSILSLTAIN